MDFHLDRKVVLSGESEFKNLYRWSLQEIDNSGKKVGRDQIPWTWSLVFTATEIELAEQLSIERHGRFGTEEEKTEITERDRIKATLRPGYLNGRDSSAYSMFGTGRFIKSFELWIYKLGESEKEEYCKAWGSLSYTTEIDFRNETMDDTLQFYLHVSDERFTRFAEMVRNHPASFALLRVGGVLGLYSDWSPSISTDLVKVLTNPDDHKIAIPEDVNIKPPTLGKVGSFDLTFFTKRVFDRVPSPSDFQASEPVEPDEAPEDAIVRNAYEEALKPRIEAAKKPTNWWLIGWRTVVQLFYIAVVLAVFSTLHDRLEHIVVALSGLIYVAVRGGIISNAFRFTNYAVSLQGEFDTIKSRLITNFAIDRVQRAEVLGEIKTQNQALYFEYAGLSAISLICLFNLFTTL